MMEEKYFLPDESKLLEFLYETDFGAQILRIMTNKKLSSYCGKFLDSEASKFLIEPFILSFKINRDEAEDREYNSFNDFFTRELKQGARKIDFDPKHLISPCDSYLSVYKIDEDSVFKIKNSDYSVERLTLSKKAAEIYKGGYCAIFRLTVSDFHRYIYFDDCKKSENRFIEGILHTVNPAAISRKRVYTENCRELCIMESENFGKVTQIEVGAMLVGRIKNHHGKGDFHRGEEKGMFLYGGSTVVLLFEKDKVKFSEDMLSYSLDGLERKVCLGEMIGEKIESDIGSDN